ncbi:MAG TPA: sigma-70 family RNA polymerase sigma factor [Thermoanaerobaculia bacterium]|nr:sigma-70 family RNA polymerase sigma factor [Thermoanaerobaculia bacterium]
MQEPRSETKYSTPVRPGEAAGAPVRFEEAYLQFAPLLRKIAAGKYGIPVAEAEPLVHDVFATYFANVDEVRDVRTYLIGGICNAARHHLRRADAKNALFCEESPCGAVPTESIVAAVERKLLVRRVLARVGERCRELLHRYYLNGETTEALADELRFKPSTILIFLFEVPEAGPVGVPEDVGAAIMSHVPETDLALHAVEPEVFPAGRRREIEAHLAACAECQESSDFLRIREDGLAADLGEPDTWEPAIGNPDV